MVKLFVAGVVLLLVLLVLLRLLVPARSYRARCKDCAFVQRVSNFEEAKAAAIFHNLQSREKGEGHQVVIEQKG